MYCHNVPGVVFISLWQISDSTLPPTPLTPLLSSLQLSLSLCSWVPSKSQHPGTFFPWSESYLWLFHSPEYWKSPLLFPLVWLYKVARPLDGNSGPIPIPFPHVTFKWHFMLLLQSYFWTYSVANDERFYPYSSFSFLSPETRCSFKNERSLSTSFEHFLLMVDLPECLPFLMKGPQMLLLPCAAPARSLSSRNIPEDYTHNSSGVRWIWNCSLG